ncbi:MAG: hypothetical protein AB7Q17_16825 [Phycisphaerae bacterium]
MSHRARTTGVIAAAIAALAAPLAQAQDDWSVRYRLLETSMLLEEVGPGVIVTPLTGTFDMQLVSDGDDDIYNVANFRAKGPDASVRVHGAGDFRFMTLTMPLHHRMRLTVSVDSRLAELDSGTVEPVPFRPVTLYPTFEIQLWETGAPGQDRIGLHLVAVPAHPLWFSTEIPFDTAPPPGRLIGAGAILSSGGAVIADNHDLTRNLGMMPIPPDIGLDALYFVNAPDATRKEFIFSSEQDAFSESLGPLSAGDLFSDTGVIVARNADLFGALDPDPPDVGLDALCVGLCRCWKISSERDFFSRTLQQTIGHGDLVAQHGEPLLTNAQLRARFHPVSPTPDDLGLDAFIIRDNGEVWFSLEEGFEDRVVGWIGAGDLLSDSGWVVARNARLIRRFGPVASTPDVGLDAIHVVPLAPGDMNADGFVNNFDIDAFVLALVNPDAFYDLYPEVDPNVVGDTNRDHRFNNFDIDGFVTLLTPP